jgi:hypothetical protein
MDNEERPTNADESVEDCCDVASGGQSRRWEAWPSCCEGLSGAPECNTMMERCMEGCRWFPLVPVVIGVLLVLLGYYLDPAVTRVLWMILAGLLILMGTFGLLITWRMKKVWGR